jgi:hypothetical protein
MNFLQIEILKKSLYTAYIWHEQEILFFSQTVCGARRNVDLYSSKTGFKKKTTKLTEPFFFLHIFEYIKSWK